MSKIQINETAPEDWNQGIQNVFCTNEFAEANKKEGEIKYVSLENKKAILLIKKKWIKLFSRAQIFLNEFDKELVLGIFGFLKKRGVPYARVGNTMDGPNIKLKSQTMKIIPRHTFILDLSQTEEDIWKKFNKKLRNAIRKAKKEEVIIKEVEKEEELKEYYELSLKTQEEIQKNKGRKSFFIQDYYFFEKIFASKLGNFFIAKLYDQIIAGALFLRKGEKSIYFQSFSSKNHTNKQAPSLIQWEVIKNFRKHAIKEFDLGGVTLNLDEKDSRFFIYNFKKKFNAELKEFYNIELSINKFKKLQDALIKLFYNKND